LTASVAGFNLPAVSADPSRRFAQRLERAVADAERAGLGPSAICDALAVRLVQLSVDRFGIVGARRGLQILLIGLARLDEDEESPPKLGGYGIGYGIRSVAVGRRTWDRRLP
jgi:hypothetical protein